MSHLTGSPFDMFSAFSQFWRATPAITEAAIVQAKNVQTYWAGVLKYMESFSAPSWNAMGAFLATEKRKIAENSPQENLNDYNELNRMNLRLANKAVTGSLAAMNGFALKKMSEGFSACLDACFGDGGKSISGYVSNLEMLLKVTTREYPKAIKEIKSEYGFHFEEKNYIKVSETDRFELYQVLPTRAGVAPATEGKPILIIPPYVLGANILAFLPGEERSYVHCFANQGVPTYIRIVKDIDTLPAVQTMTAEDDAVDIGYFCRQLMDRHRGRQVTLNGFCQGGYHSLAAILSGELDGLVDAFVTCASPIDGSRSKSLKEYMMALPPRFRDLSYSLKTLPNGNQVVDGSILSWVYKLRKIESESPIPTFTRDLGMFEGQRGPRIKISKTAAALNHWLVFDQKDLPVAITRMIFESYSKAIDEQGNLPVTLFGRTLNLKRLEEKQIPWLICIADNDDLVDKEASLVALEYIDAEVCVFPKGHAALATSWSIPTAECALHVYFSNPSPLPLPHGKSKMMFRGPVRFQLDLQEEQVAVSSAQPEARAEILLEVIPEKTPENDACNPLNESLEERWSEDMKQG